ncbi:MAG: hypothetical protein HZA91_16900 [Verrucomicrobia bacterium]|nr:hypothetical protein [Verrucomicrobiota bacterium]
MSTPNKPPRFRRLKRVLFAIACLVTLFVLFHVEENWRGERAWAAYKHELEAKGAKLDFASFIPPRVPDDQNFAMTPFLAPLHNFDPATGKLRETEALKRAQDFAKSLPYGGLSGRSKSQSIDLVAWRDAMRKPPGSDEAVVKSLPRTAQERAAAAPAVLAALKQYEPVIEELRAASARPHCRFNLNYAAENPATILLPHFSPLRNVCKILALRASAELAAGQSEQAIADLKLLCFIAGATKNDFLIGHLVSITVMEMAVQVIWEGLANHQWSDAQLQSLQTRLQNVDCLADAWDAFQAERAGFGCAMFDYLRKLPGNKLLPILQVLTGGGSTSGSIASGLISSLIPSGWLYFEQLNYHLVFEEQLLPIFDMTARRVYAQRAEEIEQALEKGGISSIWQHRVLVHLLLPAVATISKKSALAQTTLDQTTLACALERCRLADGKFPETLDALAPRFVAKLPHDIISGQPLKYRRDGAGYVLYSVGWNEKDDGGKPGTKSAPASEDGDWVWQMPAR